MADGSNPIAASDDSAWEDARRVEAWAGEIRVNLVRMLAILIFYARHLIEYARAAPGAPVRGRYHLAVTVIVLAWAAVAIALHLLLSRRRHGPGVKYAAMLADAFLITGICVAAGGRTPLWVLYFLLIATAPLRLSLGLVYATTAAAMAGYLFCLGYYAWYLIGFKRYYATPELRIARSTEAIYLLAMLVCGALMGQVVRQVRRMMSNQVSIAPAPAPAPAEGTAK
jgi:hypothetical protein